VSASQRVEEVEGLPAPGKKKDPAPDEFRSAFYPPGGTRVDVKESGLGPGEMPQRGFNAETDSAPAPGSRYMIHRDDTLWDIASRAKPAGATVHQTMLEIQRLNPDAFINNNINRIKAGYIIYLPGASEISSQDVDSALAEVRAQNSAWREGRDAEYAARSGPSLRISAEPEEEAAVAAAEPAAAAAPASAVTDTAGDVPTGDTAGDLAAMQERVATLERIVSLKDEQIAALQDALADDETAAEPASAEAADVDPGTEAADMPGAAEDEPGTEAAQDEVAEAVVADAAEALPAAPVEAQPAVVEAPDAKPAAPDATAEGGGIGGYLWYVLGAAVLAAGAWVFARRRGAAGREEAPVAATRADAFDNISLRDQELDVFAADIDSEDEPEDMQPARNNRGYGERKHDGYAADIEAADALAEADIYIAYGRHQQAIELLKNALASERGNPVYHLKLLEIYAELGDRGGATAQLEQLEANGDPDDIARARELMAGLDNPAPAVEKVRAAAAADAVPSSRAASAASDGPGLSPNPFVNPDPGLQSDFTNLEIETADAGDELDLSADFGGGAGSAGEELVIAHDSNGMSTKLDLARAYLDMGDDEGAKQILEEVMVEGSEQLKAEARVLLDRIG